MSQNIALGNAEPRRQSAADLKHMAQPVPAGDWCFVKRDGVGVNFGDPTRRFHKNDIERDKRVAHPECQRLRALVDEKHS